MLLIDRGVAVFVLAQFKLSENRVEAALKETCQNVDCAPMGDCQKFMRPDA